MFGTPNQFAKVIGFGVRVKDERQADRNHQIEATFEVPMTHSLADEISPAMARDLFQSVKGEFVPKAELTEAKFALKPETQSMVVREHPDMAPMLRVEGVTLRKIRVRKTDAGSWALVFTATWVLGQDSEATSMIRSLKASIYVTLQQQQPSLLDPGQVPDNGKEVKTDGGGNVQSITSKPKRRRRQTPEDEAKQQAKDAKARKDDDAAGEANGGNNAAEPDGAGADGAGADAAGDDDAGGGAGIH